MLLMRYHWFLENPVEKTDHNSYVSLVNSLAGSVQISLALDYKLGKPRTK